MSAGRRAVIIGGGLGGLALALRLSVSGWSVRLFEQGTSLGGKMNRWSKDGFTFDTGPSLITMPFVFRELFHSAGERMGDHLELAQVEPHARYVYPDGTRFDVSNRLPEWLETLRSLEPRADSAFLQFMRLGGRIFDLSQGTFFRTSPREFGRPPDLAALRHFPLSDAWGLYSETVARYFRSPVLRQLYERYPTYVGSSPYRCPATLCVIPYIEHTFGAWHVRGGLYRIVETLAELARRNGAVLETGRRVVRILTTDRRVRAVELEDGETVDCDAAVMNGDASTAGALLGEPGSDALPEEERSLSGFVMLVGLRRRLPDHAHHTVYFSEDYPREFRQLFDEMRFPDDPTVYVCIPGRTDPSVAPSDGEALFIMANAPASSAPEWDDETTRRARSRVLQRLRRSGFPDIEQDIVVESLWTPARFAQTYSMPGGAIYGKHSHGWANAFLRPPNRDRRYRGMYYVGGSTHPGGGTPTVLMSARITAELMDRLAG
ncbi:MAG: phytoene desaturase [Armatimonadota bacterium]|nr:MAG: phytoene desaturase [Armatimonadota bacterium]